MSLGEFADEGKFSGLCVCESLAYLVKDEFALRRNFRGLHPLIRALVD